MCHIPAKKLGIICRDNFIKTDSTAYPAFSWDVTKYRLHRQMGGQTKFSVQHFASCMSIQISEDMSWSLLKQPLVTTNNKLRNKIDTILNIYFHAKN